MHDFMILAADVIAPEAGKVSANPTTDGLPAASLIVKLLGYLAQIGLYASLASVLIGAAMWGISNHAGNSLQASRGRVYALGGAVGAILVGVAPSIINGLFTASSGN